jgi:aryl-alcohol dehydrogenase-like predicted oxidoreductase
MEYRRLGKSGLKVSELCLGTMMFGDRTDEPTAQRIADSAADAGVNFIDTADSYAKSVSEQITGKVIGAKRDRWILATKVYNRMGSEPNDSGPRPPLADEGNRREPEAPEHQLSRYLVFPRRRSQDADRGIRRGGRRHHPRGQGPLLRPEQLPVVARRPRRACL